MTVQVLRLSVVLIQAKLTDAYLLIENNASVNPADNEQRTALSYASELGFAEIVEQLITAGAEG